MLFRSAVDGSGNVYVADQNNYRIEKFDSTGTFLTKWGSSGSGDGQFNQPTGVAVDGSGNVYVADTGNRRIQKFDSAGTFLTKWSGSGDGQFLAPFGVAVDGSSNVYVVDAANRRIEKFDGTGTFLTKWGSSGSGDGQFNDPTGVAVDGSGNVFVADTRNNRIQKFAPAAVAPTVATEIHDGSHAPVTSVPLSSSIHDHATLSASNGTPTGTVDFKRYQTNDCSGSHSDENGVSLAGGVAESSATAALHAGSYSYKVHYTSGDAGSWTDADSDCETLTVSKADPSVATVIHRGPGHTVVTSVTMGASVHDRLTVTGNGVAGFEPAGSADFTLYRSANCTGSVVSSDAGLLLSVTPANSETAESSSYTAQPTDIPALSYLAHYGGNSDYNTGDDACEPLTVASSITGFHYHWSGDPGFPASTAYDVSTAATVKLSVAYSYRVHVIVTNETGSSITEKVQGGLTAVKGATHAIVSVSATCGAAAIKKGTNPNVVIWNASGDGKPAGPGFAMAQGQVCQLEVQINKLRLGSTGLQSITGDWTETQTGPGGFSGTSPSTGTLKVNVQP